MARFRMKKGVGSHLMRNGRDLKPGDVVECGEYELRGVMDKFDILQPDPPPDKTPKIELLIQLRPNTSSWFDVINPATGKAINTKALKKAEAEELAGHPYTEPESDPPETGSEAVGESTPKEKTESEQESKPESADEI